MLDKQCMCGFENGYHSKACPFPLYRKDKPARTRVWQEEYEINKKVKNKSSDSDPYHPANILICKAIAKAEGK